MDYNAQLRQKNLGHPKPFGSQIFIGETLFPLLLVILPFCYIPYSSLAWSSPFFVALYLPYLPLSYRQLLLVQTNLCCVCGWPHPKFIVHFTFSTRCSLRMSARLFGSRFPASFWGKLGFPLKLFSWGWCISERLVWHFAQCSGTSLEHPGDRVGWGAVSETKRFVMGIEWGWKWDIPPKLVF